MIFKNFEAFASLIMPTNILVIGIMEFKGVLSSWATEEKKRERTFSEFFYNCFIIVKSFKKTIVSFPSFMKEAFT